MLDINYLLQLHALNLVTEVGKRVSPLPGPLTAANNDVGGKGGGVFQLNAISGVFFPLVVGALEWFPDEIMLL